VNDLAPRAIAALEHLVRELGSPGDLDLTVHATRTGIKQLRAFVRLARRSIGTDAYRIEDGALRSAARIIAPARDALVLIETARSEHAASTVIGTLEREHAAALADLESGGRREAVGMLESTAIRWGRREWHGPPARSIRIGLRRTYRRAAADLESAIADAADAAFHGWRRRVKYVRYQLEGIGAPDTLVAPFTALGDDLGIEHDHSVLIGVCDARVTDPGFRDLALRSHRRRSELRARAVDVGSRLFASQPSAFVADLERVVDLA